ncbi:MAG: exo-alpha-sialidase [Phyllobacteriaceae bacterium]|nr:exo-alpha-sialidase [Phyllobacteriaceae bacterium]
MTDRLIVSTRKGLFHIARKAKGWEIESVDFLGDNVSLARLDRRNGAFYAALDHGHFGVKMHRKDKGGDWVELPAPAFPEKPEDLDERDGWGRPLPWTVMRVWSLEPGGADQPGTLWCGTIPGALFRSDDRGASWRWIKSLWDHPGRKRWMGGGADYPGIHSIMVDPRGSDTVRLGVSCGGVWETKDGGETWACRANGMRAEFMPPEFSADPEVQDPHLVVQSPSNPDRLWSQHHNGIFITSDCSANWSEIRDVSPSSFGFAVAVHPREPDTAWFVPGVKDEQRYPVGGALVVTRTRDGGKSFDVLRNGLPQSHAYDIVYRHALAIDASGDRLAFGSTTGNLFVSENQGDDWIAVSGTLPPIHAVSFG